MKLLIDIGNSTIVVAVVDNAGEINRTWRFKTVKDETLSFFRKELMAGLDRLKVQVHDIESVTISSVVPEINDKVAQAVVDLTSVMPHFFTLDEAKGVLTVDIESPSQLGRDRLADAMGAVKCYGAPVVVIDMGTATTIGVVTEDRRFIGGMIIPGVKTSLKALSTRASQLPTINIEQPRNMIGRNTLECMQSGILYGQAAMIDGLLNRILPTLQGNVKIVATGGMARQIIPYCSHEIIVDPFLQFKGIM